MTKSLNLVRCCLGLTATFVSLYGFSVSAGTLTCNNLKSDAVDAVMPVVTKPGYLQSYIDPVFGTKITRITGNPGAAIASGGTWGTDVHHQYSKIQAFNADQSLIFIETNRDGGGSGSVFLDGNTYQPVISASCPGSECLWHPTDPNKMIYVTSNTVNSWNPRTGSKTLIATFSGYSGMLFGSYEGNMTLNGNMVVFDGTNPGGKFVSFAYDLVNKVKYPDVDFSVYGGNADNTMISPLGNYLLGSVDTSAGSKPVVTDLQGNLIKQFTTSVPDHYDVTVDQNGDEVAVGSGRNSTYGGRMVKVRMRDGLVTPLSFAGGYGSHTSARGTFLQTWAVSNIFSDSSMYKNEIITYNLDGSKVYRLAHDQNPNPDYEAETHPMQSPDGLRILFASSWGSTTRPVQVYVIDLRDKCTSGTTPPADTTAPSVPANLMAAAASVSQINLSWSASTDAVGVTGYRVFRNGAVVANVTTTSYSDTGLAASTTYSYTVAAYDAAGNLSAQSTAKSATTLTPPPAGIISNSDFENGLTNWTSWGNSVNVASPVYAGASALRVGTGSGGVYQEIASKLTVGYTYTLSAFAQLGSASDTTGTVGIEFFNSSGSVILEKFVKGSSTSFSSVSLDFTVPAGFTSALVYVYKNLGGASYIYVDNMNIVLKSAPVGDTTAPSVPANLTAVAASVSQINLSWSASTDAVGVTGYRVFRNGAVVANVTATSYSDTGLAASTTYSYTVAAYDAAGNLSGQSTAKSATTLTPPPPTNLISNSGFENGLANWTSWGNSVNVSSRVYAGASALRVGTGSGGVYQEVGPKLVAGQTYTLSAFARLGSASDTTGTVGIEFFNSSGSVILEKFVRATSTSYGAVSLSVTVPAGFTSALVYVYKNSGGSSYIYVDNMKLTTP